MDGATSCGFCQDFTTLGFVDSQTLIAFSIYIYIAFSRFFSPSITSPSHFSNSHKIIPFTKSCCKCGSLTICCQRKMHLFVFLLLPLPSNFHTGFKTSSPSPCHCSFIDMSCSVLSQLFSSRDRPKLFNHFTYESWSMLSIILVTVFACFLISL